MNCQRKLKRRNIIKATVGAIVVFCIYGIILENSEINSIYTPDYEKASLDYIFEDVRITGKFSEQENSKLELSEKDYEVIFKQTGLGKLAVDYIIENKKDYLGEIKEYQKIFFDGYSYTCDRIGVLTYHERMRDEKGKKIKGNEIVDLQQGDVLVNLSTFTMGYRHGHCGIVVTKPVKDKAGKTVEAVYLGQPTKYQTTDKWRSCPTLVHLRISKDAAETKGYTQAELGALLAQYTEEKCLDVEYGFLPGIYNFRSDTIRKTHCSHLIWYVFKEFGYDVDSDGGIIVTPLDIATSNLFEIVQIYGINPDL